MKRLLILLTLPILACGGLAESISPTITPLSQPPVVSSSVTESQLLPDSTATPTEISSTAAPAHPISFPNSNDYVWNVIASGLVRPVDIQPANDSTGRLFVIEKYGVIRIIENGQLLDQPFLNISDRVDDSGNEMGLLGLTFHPNFEQNGYFYVNYTGDGGNTRISRFQASRDSADPNSESVLLIVEQPFPNHNGGALAFGPEGYLYIALGDGGLAGDPYKNGQNTSTRLGKILRIDVDGGSPYLIPADNPFGNEVWAYGLRNPWRISFDRATGDLWIGDVGQGNWEEIDYLPSGSPGGTNFGWSIMEGFHGYDADPQPGLTRPMVEYSHNNGCSVTGGYVYRGAMVEWNGIYFYGDYCSGLIWGLFPYNDGKQNKILFETGVTINSFGQDESGEIYFASDNGSLYRLSNK